ncbi:insulinoma-associated protein 1a-like [Boleophthalmus pectinirostris]|uniref:insulinoma-associated protein 1a-like n=1 Tax=Boleophthalmus pectinirostris TaxID=150288 RepID=UPI002431924E|nr:insulinoma-associated protein 1a-like [Boleophthalmus pectinirostris]
MPRGLMIKRRRGASAVSYRVRAEEEDAPHVTHAPGVFPLFPPRAQTPPRALPVQFGIPETVHALHSPTRPVSREHERRFSPVTPESFPARAALPEPETGHAPEITSTRTDSRAKRARPEERKKKTPARRLQVRDDVTTSPVLGLKIKEAAPELRAHAPPAGLVCQLCRETFPEPLALAQHRCSRIVRVEYRCDCGKAFSCSANLASHRRWHRPREHAHSDSDSAEDAPHECARCGKRFKRLASFRKHEARHEDPSACHRAAGRGHAPVHMHALST